MPAVRPGEVWVVDFGMAAKVRPALILTGTPAADELDLIAVPPAHDLAARQPLGTGDPKALSQTGRIPPPASPDHSYRSP